MKVRNLILLLLLRICRIVEKRNKTRLAVFYIAKKVQKWSTLLGGKNIWTLKFDHFWVDNLLPFCWGATGSFAGFPIRKVFSCINPGPHRVVTSADDNQQFNFQVHLFKRNSRKMENRRSGCVLTPSIIFNLDLLHDMHIFCCINRSFTLELHQPWKKKTAAELRRWANPKKTDRSSCSTSDLKNNQSLLSFLGLLELTRGRPSGMQVVVFLPSLWLQNITLLWSSLLILVPPNYRNPIIHLLPNPPKPTSHECHLLDLDCSRLLFRFSPQVCCTASCESFPRGVAAWEVRRGIPQSGPGDFFLGRWLLRIFT